MRERLLGVAEVLAWTAFSFTIFLCLRIAAIFLNLVVPAQCTESCGAGEQVVSLALMTFGLGWIPATLVHFVRVARRGAGSWFLPHTAVVVAAHVLAMVVVIRIFAEHGDGDTRASLLAACVALFDLLTGTTLAVGALLRPSEGRPVAG